MIRSPLEVTLSVWNALLLREGQMRLFGRRGAWFWLLAEPIFHVSYLMLLFNYVRVRSVGGMDTLVWIAIGLVGFLLFRHTARAAMGAVSANFAWFVYRQLRPVDTVLVAALLEAALLVCASLLLMAGTAMTGIDVLPADPLTVLLALFGLWLLGTGFGLVTSVAAELIPDFTRVLNMVMRPLYLISGVVFPLSAIPEPIRGWLMLNPVAHGLEVARSGFAPYYHAVPGSSISYVYTFALCLVVLGFALHVHFASRIIAQ